MFFLILNLTQNLVQIILIIGHLCQSHTAATGCAPGMLDAAEDLFLATEKTCSVRLLTIHGALFQFVSFVIIHTTHLLDKLETSVIKLCPIPKNLSDFLI